MQIDYHYLYQLLEKEEYVFVDLDGTLVIEELTKTLAFKKIGRNPFYALTALCKLLINKHKYKLELAKDVTHWTYRSQLLEVLKTLNNPKLILITASCENLGQKIADQLGIFTLSIGSTPTFNCMSLNKLTIMQKYTPNPFYIGNSVQDLIIFKHAKKGCLISNNQKLIKQLGPNIHHLY